MSGNNNNNNNKMCNKFYKNINRPYADIDFSQVRSWDLVMSIMESQAIAAKAQINAKYQQSQSNDLLPVHLTHVYKDNSFNYGSNNNGSSYGDESDNSSYYSDEEMSSNNTSTSNNTDSDIEIDVEDCSEDDQCSQSDNIPVTVLHLEEQMRERTIQPRQVRQTRTSRFIR